MTWIAALAVWHLGHLERRWTPAADTLDPTPAGDGTTCDPVAILTRR